MEVKPIEKNDKPFSELLKSFIQQDKLKPGLYERKIKQAWQEKMGKTINRHTLSIKLREHILTIRVSSASLKQELHFAKKEMQDNFNEILGEPYIREVRIVS